jgi:hypothetical protein
MARRGTEEAQRGQGGGQDKGNTFVACGVMHLVASYRVQAYLHKARESIKAPHYIYIAVFTRARFLLVRHRSYITCM